MAPIRTSDEVILFLTKSMVAENGERKPDVPESVELWLRAVSAQQKKLVALCPSTTPVDPGTKASAKR